MKFWTVYQDGRPLKRGLSQAHAERYAQYLSRGFDSHRANDKKRTAEFEIKQDPELISQFNENWKHRNQ